MNAIYVRQSIDKKDSISIESQIEFCKKELSTDDEFKVYSDKGFSGGNTKRPSFEQLINDVKDGRISRIIVYKLDRISRSITDFATIITTLGDHGVDFVSATEKFDTSTPMGRAMVYIIMVFAQLERETIAQRIKDNYYARGKKGFFMGGPPPLGFDRERVDYDGKKVSKLVPNKHIETVKLIYDMYADQRANNSLGNIQKYLIEEGIENPDGVNWTTLKISRMLRNPCYVKANVNVYTYFESKGCKITNDISDFIGVNGCFVYGKRDHSANKYRDLTDHYLSIGLHEGVIDSVTWLLCQNKLDKNKQIKNTGRGKHSWLSGLTKCGYCKYSMSVSKYKDIRYLNCRGKNTHKVCDVEQKTHHVDEIEYFVENELINYINNLNLSDLSTEMVDDNTNNELQIQIIEIEKQIDNLISQLANANDVVMTYINDKVSSLDEKKKELVKQINENTISTLHKSIEVNNHLEEMKNWDSLSMEDKKSLAKLYIDKVYISNDKIEVLWKA